MYCPTFRKLLVISPFVLSACFSDPSQPAGAGTEGESGDSGQKSQADSGSPTDDSDSGNTQEAGSGPSSDSGNDSGQDDGNGDSHNSDDSGVEDSDSQSDSGNDTNPTDTDPTDTDPTDTDPTDTDPTNTDTDTDPTDTDPTDTDPTDTDPTDTDPTDTDPTDTDPTDTDPTDTDPTDTDPTDTDPTDTGDPIPGDVGDACSNRDDCWDENFCDFTDMTCGKSGDGSCESRPVSCPPVWEPVCGCNDRSYGSECEAHQNAVEVQSLGSCSCGNASACQSDQYCKREVCGGFDGVCTIRPRNEDCGTAPPFDVCGCDGKTYSSECKAHQAGVEVDHIGACGGCVEHNDCAHTQFCKKSECDDQDGACTIRRDSNDCGFSGMSVCGCNGVTYTNICHAEDARQNIRHEGDCR